MLLRVLGLALIVGGLVVLIRAFGRFAIEGRGTPAPIAPTETLIVTGEYRFVRNPMYVAVLAMIAGQALLFGSVTLVIYGLLVWLAVAVFVRFYEEPTLTRGTGANTWSTGPPSPHGCPGYDRGVAVEVPNPTARRPV